MMQLHNSDIWFNNLTVKRKLEILTINLVVVHSYDPAAGISDCFGGEVMVISFTNVKCDCP